MSRPHTRIRLSVPGGVLAATLGLATAAAQSISVGTATASPGQMATGQIVVPAGIDPGYSIAVAVFNGVHRGKTVALIAGAHGTEYASIVALQRLIGRLDPKAMTGTVIVAPLLNVASFREMTVHLNPVDKKGLNRVYPGNQGGSQTERATALLAEQIVKPADVIVDLHGGDLDEDLRPYSYWFRGGNAIQDAASKALALGFGLDHIIVQDIDPANPASTGTLGGYGLSLGKTVLIAEAGRAGTVAAEDVDALVNGLESALATIGVIDRPVRAVANPVWLDGGTRVGAAGDGVFSAAVARGSYVMEGMTVGVVTDYLGMNPVEIKAPATGVVTFIRSVPSIWKGATLVNIGRVLAEPPPYRTPSR